MKKWMWLVSCVFLAVMLAACTEEKDTGDKDSEQTDEHDKEEVTNDEPGDIEELQASVARMHIEKLGDIATTVGFMQDGIDFYMGYQGLVYARIVDFNADGVDELVTLVKGSAYNLDEYAEPYNVEDYVFEVWGTDYNTYDVIYSKNIPVDECNACDLSLSIIDRVDGSSVISQSSIQMAQGTSFWNGTYFVMNKAGNFEELKYRQEAVSSSLYFIEEEEVDEKEFESALTDYEGDEEMIIESFVGTKSFVYKEPSAGKMVANIYKQYEAYMGIDTVLAEGMEMDSYLIQDVAEYVTFSDRIDVLDRSLYNEMTARIIFDTNMESDLPGHEGYLGFSSWTVVDRFLEFYGAELQLEDIEFPNFDDLGVDVYYADLLYDDGVFYAVPNDMSPPKVIRSVQRAIQIGKHIYLEVHDTEFDSYGHFVSTDTTVEEQSQLLYEPIESWPEEARKFAKSSIPRFILIRIDEGAPPVFQYIGYRPLDFEEIDPYILSF